MKICIAQTRPVKGDVESNIRDHIRLIDHAIAEGADLVVFPELSLTGYEPELAKQLATTHDDSRLNCFQTISDTANITIAVGMLIQAAQGIQIGMVIFQPHQERQTYAKQYLHEDELPYFVSGSTQVILEHSGLRLVPAICYELSVPGHAANAHKCRADLYLVSVAKSAAGVDRSIDRLSAIAHEHSMTVLMANSIGPSDNFEGGGRSGIWNRFGELIETLNDVDEGILVFDIASASTTKTITTKQGHN